MRKWDGCTPRLVGEGVVGVSQKGSIKIQHVPINAKLITFGFQSHYIEHPLRIVR